MLNNLELIGYLTEDPILKNYDNYSVCNVTLAVDRPFKNADGKKEADFIRIAFWDYNAKNISIYCRKGDLLYVKGRLQIKSREITFSAEDKTLSKKIIYPDIVGERVVFLKTSAKKKEEDEGEFIDE